MRALSWKRMRRGLGGLLIVGVLLAPLGGCPVDNRAVLVAAFDAVLSATGDSLVQSLSTYLDNSNEGG